MNKEALRYNEGKPQWSLVDFDAIEPLVRVLTYGANKYTTQDRSGRHQWRDGLKTTAICESAMRHLIAYMQGEDNDPESGQSHIGHIMANAMFLAYNTKYHPTMDDRYTDVNKITKKEEKNETNDSVRYPRTARDLTERL